MQQPYGTRSSPPMQLQTVRRRYRTADGYERDAARMQAHSFLRTRQDANGVTWERLVPWGTNPPVPAQVRERTPELWIVLGVFGALLLLMLVLIVVSSGGDYAIDNSPTAVAPPPTPIRATATGTARSSMPTQPQGIVPRPIVLPSSNPAFLPPSTTAGPVVTPIPIGTPAVIFASSTPSPAATGGSSP